MNVVGLDLSLTATGVAWPDGCAMTIRTGPVDALPYRLRFIRERIVQPIVAMVTQDHMTLPLVVIEDLPSARLAGAGTAVAGLGMVHGVVRLELDNLHDAGVVEHVVLVQPASLKKYATGKGNASKSMMLVEATKRLGYDGYDDNEADALWLRAMALDHYSEPVVKMPELNRTALAAIDWPALDVAAA